MKTLYIVIFLFTLSVPAAGQPGFPKLPRPGKITVEKDPDVRTVPARLSVGEHDELTSKIIFRGRNMADYAQGGHHDCRERHPEGDTQGICDYTKVRDFIWLHWKEKKRGYMRITQNSIDSLATSHIFIEPGKKGAWHITWMIARYSMLPGSRTEIAEMLGLDTVERVEGNGLDDWCIVIKRRNGEIFSRFPE